MIDVSADDRALLAGAVGHARPIRIVVTGAECTGKTTLATILAERLGMLLVEEAARRWAAIVKRRLTQYDIARIAHLHSHAVRHAGKASPTGLVLDTDFVSGLIYARFYHGIEPSWLVDGARQNRGDLYLLCGTDIPWVPEAGQRTSPAQREVVQALLKDELAHLGAHVVPIDGPVKTRLSASIEAIDALRPWLCGAWGDQTNKRRHLKGCRRSLCSHTGGD